MIPPLIGSGIWSGIIEVLFLGLDESGDEGGDEVAKEEGGEEAGEERDHERDFGRDPDFGDAGIFEGLEVAGFVEVVGDAREFAFAVDEFFQGPDEGGLGLCDGHLVAEEGVGHGEVVSAGVVENEADGDDEEEEDAVGEDDPGPGHDGRPEGDVVEAGDEGDEDGEGHHGFGVSAAEDESELEEGVHQGDNDGDEDEVVDAGAEAEVDVLDDEQGDSGAAHDDPEVVGGVSGLDVGIGGVE